MDTMSSVPASRGAGSLYAGRNSRPTSPNAPNPTYASLGPSDHSGPSRGHQGVRGYQQPTQYTTIQGHQQPSIVINSDQQAYPTYQDPLYATRGQGSQQSDIFWDWYNLLVIPTAKRECYAMHGDTCMFMVEKIQPTVSDKIKEYSHTFPKEKLTSNEIVHKKSTPAFTQKFSSPFILHAPFLFGKWF